MTLPNNMYLVKGETIQSSRERNTVLHMTGDYKPQQYIQVSLLHTEVNLLVCPYFDYKLGKQAKVNVTDMPLFA
jgi:hypothetical protein